MAQDKPKNTQDKKQEQDIDLMTDKEKQADSQKDWKDPDESVPGGKGPRSPGDEDDQGDR